MQLTQLIKSLSILSDTGLPELEITGLAYHSKKVKPGNLFVAISGTQVDGHQFIHEAIQRGAAALVVENDIPESKQVPTLKVSNSRQALSQISAIFYGYPSQSLKVVGVTGTNGKTTITCLVEKMLSEAGIPVGRLGTIGFQYLNKFQNLDHTTPESLEIQGYLREMLDHSVEVALMEVSSHAVDLHRVNDIEFDIAIFTNLTPEHLDYHRAMEHYYQAKKKLFSDYLPRGKGLKRAIINAEDSFGQRLLEEINCDSVWTYSTQPQSKWDFYVRQWKSDLHGLKGTLATPVGVRAFDSPLIGAFNLSNILAATATALSLGVALDDILKTLKTFSHVPGRLERIKNSKGLHIFVDYAHTPDALKNVLQALRQLNPSRLLTLFGCGGDRDRTKRPIMGREAARFSDLVVVTNDNPRTEDPKKIIQDILPGIQEGGLTIEKDCWIYPDREEAIQNVIQLAQPGDVVLIAGKGHEDYQILGKTKVHFDDREQVRQALKRI